MARKVLVALDDSKGSWLAVRYAAETFAALPNAQVELLHVFPEPPPYFWDFGHILRTGEDRSIRRLADGWKARQEQRWETLWRKALRLLTKAGLPPAAVSPKSKRTDSGAAQGILDEARAGGFDTIVMGRRGLGTGAAALLGSVTNKVLQGARGCAVVIAE